VLIRGERHLDRVLREFVQHYNHERPHPRDRARNPFRLPDRATVHGPEASRTNRPAWWSAPRVPRRRLIFRPLRPTPVSRWAQAVVSFDPSGTSLLADLRRSQMS
jgi:hypothetical protein